MEERVPARPWFEARSDSGVAELCPPFNVPTLNCTTPNIRLPIRVRAAAADVWATDLHRSSPIKSEPGLLLPSVFHLCSSVANDIWPTSGGFADWRLTPYPQCFATAMQARHTPCNEGGHNLAKLNPQW